MADLDSEKNHIKEKISSLEDDLNEIIRRFDSLVSWTSSIHRRLDTLTEKDLMRCEHKKPHRCPICGGKRNLKEEVEPKIFKFELCVSCDGKGIVWG